MTNLKSCFDHPSVWASNGIERVNKEIKRRTGVETLFPNEESLLHLVSAVLPEISEERETGKVDISMETE